MMRFFLSLLFILLGPNASAEVPNTFQAGTPAQASEVNQNFQSMDARINNNASKLEDFASSGIEYASTDVTILVPELPTLTYPFSLTITVPVPGFIKVDFSAWVNIFHLTETNDRLICQLESFGNQFSVLPGSERWVQVPRFAPLDLYAKQIHTQGVLEVYAADSYDIRVWCYAHTTSRDVEIKHGSLIATFFPTRL